MEHREEVSWQPAGVGFLKADTLGQKIISFLNKLARVCVSSYRSNLNQTRAWHSPSFDQQPERNALPNTMKKNLKKVTRATPSLGELILAVSSVSRNNREAIAAVADLLDTGRVCLNSNGRKIRARVF
jgi:hypothetical protein